VRPPTRDRMRCSVARISWNDGLQGVTFVMLVTSNSSSCASTAANLVVFLSDDNTYMMHEIKHHTCSCPQSANPARSCNRSCTQQPPPPGPRKPHRLSGSACQHASARPRYSLGAKSGNAGRSPHTATWWPSSAFGMPWYAWPPEHAAEYIGTCYCAWSGRSSVHTLRLPMIW
jgi:hypothetical protein